MMKLVVALTALIVMAQAQPMEIPDDLMEFAPCNGYCYGRCAPYVDEKRQTEVEENRVEIPDDLMEFAPCNGYCYGRCAPYVDEKRQTEVEENRMGPVEAMKMEALIVAATTQFCKDVASGNDEAAWAHVDKALAFECGPKGKKPVCDELTADKDLGLDAIAGKLGCK